MSQAEKDSQVFSKAHKPNLGGVLQSGDNARL